MLKKLWPTLAASAAPFVAHFTPCIQEFVKSHTEWSVIGAAVSVVAAHFATSPLAKKVGEFTGYTGTGSPTTGL
jgi:hypothetical protein